MATKHVIIGNGPAGMHAIETIRKYGRRSDEIHLVAREEAYSRMVLPYWIARKIHESHVLTANPTWYSKARVQVHKADAVRVDPVGHEIALGDGTKLAYDNLLIATGSSPAAPPIEGADLPGVQTMWTMDDARTLSSRIGKDKRVLFVGAGFIGFIVLNALAKIRTTLEVVEVAPQVLPRMLDAAAAAIVQDHLTRQGIKLHTGHRVEKITAQGEQLVSQLSGGASITTDAVVLATGVKPNVGFLRGSGITLGEGIIVDHHLRSNFPNVYAAGDCAQGPDCLGGPDSIHAIQPTAIDHGRIAGANMTGRDVRYDGSLSLNILDLVGLQAASIGQWAKNDEAQVIRNEAGGIYRKLVWEGDRLVGAILLGPADNISNLNDMGMVKGMIQTRTSLGKWKQHLAEQPLDIRRAYFGSGIATRLLEKTLLPDPAADTGYRHRSAKPSSAEDAGPHHAVFVENHPKTTGA